MSINKPQVSIPDGPPPAELQIDDLEIGDGPQANSGDLATVHYVGVSFATGKEFDSSWDRDSTFTFGLGKREVISGWDQGVAGMKVGGRRQLTIPPSLAYGERGAPPVIGPNETLVFVVDLMAVN